MFLFKFHQIKPQSQHQKCYIMTEEKHMEDYMVDSIIEYNIERFCQGNF